MRQPIVSPANQLSRVLAFIRLCVPAGRFVGSGLTVREGEDLSKWAVLPIARNGPSSRSPRASRLRLTLCCCGARRTGVEGARRRTTPEERSSSSKTIMTANYIVKGLTQVGHIFDRAPDGRDDLFLAAGEKYDAQIVDRMLPGSCNI
jgi:hypothetical protein